MKMTKELNKYEKKYIYANFTIAMANLELEELQEKTAGIDGVTKTEYAEKLEENLDRLVKRLKNKGYKPTPAKRVYNVSKH